MANVIDAELDHRDSFNAHAKSESAPLIRIDTSALEHVGIYHSAAEQLEPASMSTGSAAIAHAERALAIEFGARFGKGEEVRSKARL